jgi:hypothetical protein
MLNNKAAAAAEEVRTDSEHAIEAIYFDSKKIYTYHLKCAFRTPFVSRASHRLIVKR